MHLQLIFNQLAGTSMHQQIAYLDATDKFHEKLRLFFYPNIFEGKQANSIDWDQFTPEYHQAQINLKPIQGFAPLLIGSLLMILISIPKIRRL